VVYFIRNMKLKWNYFSCWN